MFKYTAHPEVLRRLRNIDRRSKKSWDDRYMLALSITKTARAYFACGDFWRHYQACDFYSVARRTEVPVNGVLLPVEFFVESTV